MTTPATPGAATGPALPDGKRHSGAAIQGLSAGVVSRSLAAVVDALVVLVIEAGLWGGVTLVHYIRHPRHFTVPSPTVSFAAVTYGMIAVLYLTLSWGMVGRTTGAQLFGLRVTRADGRRAGWLTSIARAAFCVVFPVGLLWSAVSRGSRSVQDLVLGTYVVYDWGHQVVPAAGGDET